MPILASDKGGKDFNPVPEGAHIAVCNAVVDCGVQPGGKFKPQHKVYIRFEVPTERIEFERDGVRVEGPMQIGKFWTVSLHEKSTLRKDLQNWRGQSFTADELAGFDIERVAGTACQIMVSHDQGSDGKVYARITGVMAIPKGMPRPKAEHPVLVYAPDKADTFDKLPTWLQKKIREQVIEGAQAEGPQPVPGTAEVFDDEIPF